MLPLPPKVIFEDKDLLVIDKPPGLVVDKSETQNSNTLEDWLSEYVSTTLERQGIVHRLDKDTSGLIIVAKTASALENLQSQFANRIVKKKYLALVHGQLDQPRLVEGSIGRNPTSRQKFVILEEGGKEASTRFEAIDNFQFSIFNFQSIFNDLNKIQKRKLERMNYNQFTLVGCFPLTGRTHQIRVHLKYIGFPIVADQKYAGRKVYRLDKRWCPRQFLHAAKIGFNHPVSGEWMEFESPLAQDLKEVLKKLDVRG